MSESGDNRPTTSSDEDLPTGAQRLVTVRNLKLVEAEMAAAKLNDEGIAAVVIDREMSVANPLVIPYARVQVSESDLARAEEILSRPAPDDAEGEYVKEDWRCPKCHRKPVELMPLAGTGLLARTGCLGMLALTVAGGLASWLVPEWTRVLASLSAWEVLPWFAVGMALFLIWIFSARQKKCTSCGHVWGTGDAGDDGNDDDDDPDDDSGDGEPNEERE